MVGHEIAIEAANGRRQLVECQGQPDLREQLRDSGATESQRTPI